eukprot:3267312-Amphidinium_carterae.4
MGICFAHRELQTHMFELPVKGQVLLARESQLNLNEQVCYAQDQSTLAVDKIARSFSKGNVAPYRIQCCQPLPRGPLDIHRT